MMGGTVRTWLALTLATIGSWWLAQYGPPYRAEAAIVILIAAFKIHLVVGHFMELGWRPPPFRYVLSGWIALVTGIILTGNFMIG
ncbi:MAG: cytochrome C oxidase subunit IV family protein [Sphingopyxis sp.]